jgi:DNA (cytosine-5)-methyltransferase 1
MPPPPTFIEVCAGAGGLSTGLMEAGFEPLLLNEIHKTYAKTLADNHIGANVVVGSMTDLDLRSYAGRVDLLCGGVPCQAFSLAGAGRGLDDNRGALIVEFNRLINECQPRVFMVENVKGLMIHDGGQTFRDILQLFANDGAYTVHHKLLSAVDYEVPQKRERVLIVGVRTGGPEFAYPPPCPNRKVLRDVLPNCPPSSGSTYPEAKRRVMELVPPGGCWVNLPPDVQASYMGASLNAGGGKRGMARRLSMDEPCLTLTTSPAQKQTERCHPTETRPLTVREYARIQTFPDSYVFAGGVGAQYAQIGNAVPVRLAYFMGKAIAAHLSAATD